MENKTTYEPLNYSKDYKYYNNLLKGRLFLNILSKNKFFIHGVMPKGGDKDNSLNNCIVIMTMVYDPEKVMKYISLTEFYAPTLKNNLQYNKYIVEEKEEIKLPPTQPAPTTRINQYREQEVQNKLDSNKLVFNKLGE
jgi:hypothetical protein